jgi:tetratricopeptide (TPR) repeat protein
MRRTVTALAAASLALAVVPAATAAVPCDPADALLAAHRLDDASKLYAELLKVSPPPDCAVTGLVAVGKEQAKAQQLVAEALKAEEEGDPDEALVLARQAVDTDKTSLVASALYEKLNKSSKFSLKKWFDDAAGWLTSAVPFLGPLLVLLALLLTRLVRRRLPPLVNVEKFEDATKDLAIGVGLTDMLVDEIQSDDSSGSVERVTNDPSSSAVDVSEILGTKWKGVAALLRVLSWHRVINVRGDVFVITGDDPKKPQCGVTINVVGGRHIISTRTFRVRDHGGSEGEQLFSVIPYAGAWVAETLASQRSLAKPPPPSEKDWRSWGYFRQGVRHHENNQVDKARSLYVKSIEAEANSVAAWLNLVSLDVRNEKDWPRALRRLDVVNKLIDDDLKPADANWHRALYWRTVTLLHQQKSPVQALECAVELVHHVARSSLAFIGTRPSAAHTGLNTNPQLDLQRLVYNMEGRSVALLAAAMVENGELPALEGPVVSFDRVKALTTLADLKAADVHVDDVLGLLHGLYDRTGMPSSARYNLACTYARAFGLAKSADDKKHYLDRAMADLEAGVEGRQDWVDWAREKDTAFKAVRDDPAAKRRFLEILDQADTSKPATSEDTEGWTVLRPAS